MNEGETKRFGVSEVADFCARNDTRGLCCGGWPRDLLEIHIHFYNSNRSVFLVHDDSELVGVGVGWRCNEDDLGRHWTTWRDEGDCFYISDLICISREAIQTLVDGLSERCPGWRNLKLFAKRDGRIRRYGVNFFERLNGRKQHERAVS